MMGQRVKVLSDDGLRVEREGFVCGQARMMDGTLKWCVCDKLDQGGKGGIWVAIDRVLRLNEAPNVDHLNSANLGS
jgi:hypothetical protein